MPIKVRVHTHAKKETVLVEDEGHVTISVKEKPLDNAANRRVVELIARLYQVSISKVHIIRGHRATAKTLMVD